MDLTVINKENITIHARAKGPSNSYHTTTSNANEQKSTFIQDGGDKKSDS